MNTPGLLKRNLTLRQRLLKLFLLLTAPGVILHEISHELICIWQRIPIGDVVYFQMGDPAGYVEHGSPRSWAQAFLLSMAPLFINIFAALWFFSAAFSGLSGGSKTAVLALFCIWLGFSAIVHSLPSPQDIKNLWNYTTGHIIRYPFIIIAGPLYAIVLLTYKLGMYYVSVPLAIGIFAGVLLVFQVDPMLIGSCLIEGQWGCWDSITLFDLLIEYLA